MGKFDFSAHFLRAAGPALLATILLNHVALNVDGERLSAVTEFGVFFSVLGAWLLVPRLFRSIMKIGAR